MIGGDDDGGDDDGGVWGEGSDCCDVEDGDDGDGVRGFDDDVVAAVLVIAVVVAEDDGVGESCSNICISSSSSDGADVEDGGAGVVGDVERVDDGIVAEYGTEVETDGDVHRK